MRMGQESETIRNVIMNNDLHSILEQGDGTIENGLPVDC